MKLLERWRVIRRGRGWKEEAGMDERMERLRGGELHGDEEWDRLEREGRLPGPRDDPPEEPSHQAARIADRERGRERGDFDPV